MRHLARPALFLVLASVALSQDGPDPFLLERVLAPGALLYVSVPQSAAVSEDYKKSNLARLWNHEEIRSFLEPVEKYWKKRKTEPAQVGGDAQPPLNEMLKQTVGLTIDELWDLLGGPLGFAVYDVPLNEQHKFDLVLSLGAPDPAKLEKAAASLKDALKRQGEFNEGEFRHQGITVREFGDAQFRVYYAVVEKTLVVTTLQDRIQKIITASADKAFAGLRQDAKFKAARARVAPDNRHFFMLYLNATGILQQFRREIGDEALKVLETLGLADVTSIAAAMAYDGGPIRERYALLTARQDRGILKFLAGGTPADPAAAQVPAGAVAYGHFGLNLAELYETLLACAKVSPEFDQQLGETLKGYEQRVGISLREAFGSIGSSWTMVSVLPEAGGLFPDDLYIVSLADPARFEAALDKVAKDAGFPTGEMSFRGQRIRHFTIGFAQEQGFDLPSIVKMGTAVSWFVKDKTLYASTNPLSLKRHLVRLGGKLTPLGEDPRFREVASKLARGDWESWYYMDTGRWVAALYNTVEPFVHIVRDFARDPWTGEPIVDAARLPLGETLGELLGPSLTNKRTLPDAIVVDSLSTPAVSMTSFAGVVAVAAAVAVPAFVAMRAPAGGIPAGGIAGNERVAELSLLFIRQAQETFKNSDSDRNGAADYWTRDVAGLYGLKDKAGQAIFLLDPGTAQADPDGAARYGLGAAPKNGYHFRMLTTDPDGEAYQKDDDKDGQSFTNKSRYGVVAYPAAYGTSGRFTFLMGENGKVWKKDTTGQPVTKWPGKDPAKDDWTPAE